MKPSHEPGAEGTIEKLVSHCGTLLGVIRVSLLYSRILAIHRLLNKYETQTECLRSHCKVYR